MVILVDANDKQIGEAEKVKAHENHGMLHRAVSVIIYRVRFGNIEILIQQRSQDKLLWPLFWANTICTHPEAGEDVKNCAVRRLKEELGVHVLSDSLELLFVLKYQAQFNENFAENEIDHVFTGAWDGRITRDKKEVESFEWIEAGKLIKKIAAEPEIFTPWFSLMIKSREFNNFIKKIKKSK
jgi:isopentenyl-diphosphate Delta-isomerase